MRKNYNANNRVDYSISYSESKPISSWGYVGYNFLWSIPVVGFILWIVACFNSAKPNVKNYARSIFISYVLIIAINIVAFIAFVVLLAMNLISTEEFQSGIEAIAMIAA